MQFNGLYRNFWRNPFDLCQNERILKLLERRKECEGKT